MNKIPKIIHQIWVGKNKIPKNVLEYQKTWAKYHPNWKIMFWTDENIHKLKNINFDYIKLCKNYSEQSDYLRYLILYNYGGIYVDIDFECLQSFNNLPIQKEKIFLGSNFDGYPTGLLWASKKNKIIKEILENIPSRLKKWKNLNSFLKIGPWFVSQYIEKYHENIKIFPDYVFYPFKKYEDVKMHTKENLISKGVFALHHDLHSWSVLSKIKKNISKIGFLVPFLKWYDYLKSFFSQDK